MNRQRSWILTTCLSVCALAANAQISGDTLKGVEVRSQTIAPSDAKAAFQPGARVVGIDSALRQLYTQQSIATLISQVTSVFIKSYGFNSLATLSFRGSSSAQSAVYWEGIPIMNGATGLSDLSLLSVAFSDSISLQYGSSGALGGSGNVGGALLLGSKQASFSPDGLSWHAAAGAGLGSFAHVPLSAELGLRSSRVFLRGRAIRTRAANGFPAIDQYGQRFQTEHSALKADGLLLDAAFRIDGRNVLSLHAWHQSYSREIPRALFEASSYKLQDDGASRFMLDWKRRGKDVRMYAKLAYMHDLFSYRDTAIGLASTATTDHYYGELGIQGEFGTSTSWLVFVPLQQILLENGAGSQSQYRSAIAANLKRSFYGARLQVAANARGEVFDDKKILLPGVSASYAVGSSLLFRASVQRSYRVPTLNERYYEPGGNKSLKPEQGWSMEAGGSFTKKFPGGISLNHSLTGYNRLIRDWIIWLGGAIWTPHNLASVHSRGLESEHAVAGESKGVHWRLAVSAAYTRSTPTESYLVNDRSIGRQLPYTPLVTGSGVATVNWKGGMLSYVHSYCGERFITADESASLAPYTTGNVMIQYMLGNSRGRVAANASIQNIWNSRYAVVAYRPMPGINYLISIVLSRD